MDIIFENQKYTASIFLNTDISVKTNAATGTKKVTAVVNMCDHTQGINSTETIIVSV